MYKHKGGVFLRKIEPKDLTDLLDLKQESWWGTHKTSIINSVDQRRWFDSIPDDELYMIGEIDFPLGMPIGVAAFTGIDWVNRTAQVSGSIYRECRSAIRSISAFSAGLDFAFEILNMRRVEAEVLEYHVAAQKLEIDHLGFTVEGRKRQCVYKSGQYYDSIMLGMLREDWEQHSRVLGYNGSCNLNFDHDRFKKLSERFGRV